MSRFINLIVLALHPFACTLITFTAEYAKYLKKGYKQNITYLFDPVGYNSPDPSGTSYGVCRTSLSCSSLH